MTERERLIKLIYEALLDMSGKYIGDPTARCESIADYLLDHGVIVPPRKVGDTVYYMHNGGGRVYEGVVTSFIYVSDTKSFGIHCDGIYGKYGVYVFPTREEAEAALAERRKA